MQINRSLSFVTKYLFLAFRVLITRSLPGETPIIYQNLLEKESVYLLNQISYDESHTHIVKTFEEKFTQFNYLFNFR
jgi:hypothetical protein